MVSESPKRPRAISRSSSRLWYRAVETLQRRKSSRRHRTRRLSGKCHPLSRETRYWLRKGWKGEILLGNIWSSYWPHFSLAVVSGILPLYLNSKISLTIAWQSIGRAFMYNCGGFWRRSWRSWFTSSHKRAGQRWNRSRWWLEDGAKILRGWPNC